MDDPGGENKTDMASEPDEPPISDCVPRKHSFRFLNLFVLFQHFSFLDILTGGCRFSNTIR